MKLLVKFARILAVILVTAVLIYLSGVLKAKPEATEGERIKRIPVQTQIAAVSDQRILLPSQGMVSAITQASLAAEVSGTVLAVAPSFEIGGSFKKGELLVTIDDRDYIAAVKLAESNYQQVAVAFKEEQVRSEQAVRDWQRLGNTVAPSDLVARKPQLAAAEASLAAAAAQLDKAKLDLSRTKVYAPYDGRLISEAIDPGNYVSPGVLLANIIEAGKLKVDLPVSASWRHLLDTEDAHAPVQISLAYGGKNATWQGLVQFSSANISANSRQFRLIAYIDLGSASLPEAALLIGDYVTAEIYGKRLRDVIVVPRDSVYEGNYLWVMEGDEIFKRSVELVWADAERAILGAGLNAGEKYVITPLGNVISGTAVREIDDTATLNVDSGEA